MQGYVLTRYKHPMELREVPKPQAGEGEVLIRVRAAGLNPTDYKIRDGVARLFYRMRSPTSNRVAPRGRSSSGSDRSQAADGVARMPPNRA